MRFLEAPGRPDLGQRALGKHEHHEHHEHQDAHERQGGDVDPSVHHGAARHDAERHADVGGRHAPAEHRHRPVPALAHDPHEHRPEQDVEELVADRHHDDRHDREPVHEQREDDEARHHQRQRQAVDEQRVKALPQRKHERDEEHADHEDGQERVVLRDEGGNFLVGTDRERVEAAADEREHRDRRHEAHERPKGNGRPPLLGHPLEGGRIVGLGQQVEHERPRLAAVGAQQHKREEGCNIEAARRHRTGQGHHDERRRDGGRGGREQGEAHAVADEALAPHHLQKRRRRAREAEPGDKQRPRRARLRRGHAQQRDRHEREGDGVEAPQPDLR